MHIIHHLDARELLFMLPDLRRGGLPPRREEGLSGSSAARSPRASRSSSSSAAARTRTRSTRSCSRRAKSAPRTSTTSFASASSPARRNDLFPMLALLPARALSRSTTSSPGRRTNTLVHFRSYCESHPHLARCSRTLQRSCDDEETDGARQPLHRAELPRRPLRRRPSGAAARARSSRRRRPRRGRSVA